MERVYSAKHKTHAYVQRDPGEEEVKEQLKRDRENSSSAGLGRWNEGEDIQERAKVVNAHVEITDEGPDVEIVEDTPLVNNPLLTSPYRAARALEPACQDIRYKDVAPTTVVDFTTPHSTYNPELQQLSASYNTELSTSHDEELQQLSAKLNNFNLQMSDSDSEDELQSLKDMLRPKVSPSVKGWVDLPNPFS